MCLGSDNLALPMAGLQDAAAQIHQSLQYTQVLPDTIHELQVRYAEVREAWAEEPQLELIAGSPQTVQEHGGSHITSLQASPYPGPRPPWPPCPPSPPPAGSWAGSCTGPSGEQAAHQPAPRGVPVGLLGVYVNTTDLWPWTPLDTLHHCNSTRPGSRWPSTTACGVPPWSA